MAEKTISIGGFEDIIIYDDTEFDNAFITDGVVKAAEFSSGTEVGQSSTFTVVTDSRIDGTQLQKKTRSLTFTKGLLTTVGSESAWTNTDDI